MQRGTLTSQHVPDPVGWMVARPPETPSGLLIVLPGRGNVAADVVDPALPVAEPSFPEGCHDERFGQVAFPGHLAFFRAAPV